MGDLEPLPVQTPAKLNEASRKQQLAEWASSETAKVDPSLKNKNWSVKFPLELMFLSACENGDVEYANELLEMGVDINAKNSDGLAALHQATVNTDEDMMTFLIENNADLDIFDNEGWTPLHAAASVGSLNFVSILIEKGANPVAVNHDGDTPYDLVKSDSNDEVTDVAQYLLRVIDERGIDLEACKHAEENLMREDSLRWLADRDREAVNRQHPETKATPLHVAASKNFIDIMRNLLRAGADPNMQDKDDWTPLHAAAHWSLYDAAKLLAEYGANFKIQNRNQHTPKDLAESDMLNRMIELEAQQTNLIEARKCNPEEIDDSLNRPTLNSARRRKVSDGLLANRSSVCRASMADKENFVKIKDQQLEKIQILNAEKLPTVPQTPCTPTPLEEKLQNLEATKVEDSNLSGAKGRGTGSAAATRDIISGTLPTIATAETASVTSDGDDDTTSSATNTFSSTESRIENPPDPAHVSKFGIKSKEDAVIATKASDSPKTDAIGEFIRELEISDDQPKSVDVASRTIGSVYDDISSPLPARRRNSLVRQRIDRLEKTPLNSTAVKFGPTFSRASQSNESVSMPQPKVIQSRKLKEPPPPPPEELKVSTTENVVAVKIVSRQDSILEEKEPKEEKQPTANASDEKTRGAVLDSNLLSEQSAATSEKTEAGQKEKDSTEETPPADGPLKRGASWRVRKPKKDTDNQKSSKPGTEGDQSEKVTTEGDTPVKKNDEEEQTTPNTMLLPKNEEKEITRKQRARFERHTRRSTQGISAADLEEALASPHHHPIREDKKEVRERIESKFMGASPALASPPAISNNSVTSSNSSKAIKDATVERGGVDSGHSGSGTQPQPPSSEMNEVGFVRTNRYTRLTSRDVDGVLATAASAPYHPNSLKTIVPATAESYQHQTPQTQVGNTSTLSRSASTYSQGQTGLLATSTPPPSALITQNVANTCTTHVPQAINSSNNTSSNSLCPEGSNDLGTIGQANSSNQSNVTPTYPSVAAAAAPNTVVCSASNTTNKTNTSTNAVPVAKTFSRPYENLPQRTPMAAHADSTTMVPDKSGRPVMSGTANEYKGLYVPSTDLTHKNSAVVNIGDNSVANRPSLGPSTGGSVSNTSPYHPGKDLSDTSLLSSNKSSFRPFIPQASKITSSSGSLPAGGRRKTEYVSVSVPFSANTARPELLPSKSSSFDSGTTIPPYPSVPNPYSIYPGSAPPNNREHKGQKSTNSFDYYSKQLSPENTLTKGTIDPGYTTASKIYDVFEPRSFDQSKSSSTRPKTYSDASGLRQTLVIPSSSKVYSASTGGPSTDFSSQSARKDLHLHHTGAPLGRSSYTRYTPLSPEKTSALSHVPYSSLSTDPYLKSYSDRSLDAYFREGMSKYTPVHTSPGFEAYPKYGGGLNSSSSGGLGGQYQFTAPVIISRPLSMDTSPASTAGGRMSGYRSPPLDPSSALSRSASMKDRHGSGPLNSSYSSHYKY